MPVLPVCRRGLKHTRAFAEAWPDEAIVQGALAQMTWYHNLALLEKLKGREERLWYAAKAVENSPGGAQVNSPWKK